MAEGCAVFQNCVTAGTGVCLRTSGFTACRAELNVTVSIGFATSGTYDFFRSCRFSDGITRNFPPYKTSMLQDFEAGRALEVEAILGNTLRIARRHRVAVPRIESCYALLKSVDELNRLRRAHQQ